MHTPRIPRARNSLRIIRHERDIIPPPHQLLHFSRPAVGISLEDLHHVFLGVGDGVGGFLAVGRDVEGLVVVEHFEDVGGWWGGDDGRGDDLVHGFVVAGMGGVVDEAGAAAVDVWILC